MQDTLRFLRRFDAEACDAVLAAIPEESRKAIDTTMSLDWISLEHDRHVPLQTFRVLGPERAHEFFRWQLAHHVEGPLLRSTLSAVKRLFGLSPGTLARALTVAFPVVFRGFGTLSVSQPDAHKSEVLLADPHPDVITSGYPEALRAIFHGFYALSQTEGSSDVAVEDDPPAIRWTLRW